MLVSMPGRGDRDLEMIPRYSFLCYVKKVAQNGLDSTFLHMRERFRLLRELPQEILRHIYDDSLGKEETVYILMEHWVKIHIL